MLACSLDFPASKFSLPHPQGQLCLRPFREADAPEIIAAIDESLSELRPFLPFAHIPQTLESQITRIRGQRGSHDMGFGLFREGTTRMLAGCGLHPRVPLNPHGTEIGFWTRSSETGRGWATLMTRVLLMYAFEGLDMDRVQVLHNVENLASQKVIEKCGFLLEGRVRNVLDRPTPEALAGGMSSCRDGLCYSLLPEEARQLPWYGPLCRETRVFDVMGFDLGLVWRD